MNAVQCEEVVRYQIAEAASEGLTREVKPVKQEIYSIVVETTYVAVGLKHADEKVTRVRINEKPWRSPRDSDWNAMLNWLFVNEFEKTHHVFSKSRTGTQTGCYFFRKDYFTPTIERTGVPNPISGTEVR